MLGEVGGGLGRRHALQLRTFQRLAGVLDARGALGEGGDDGAARGRRGDDHEDEDAGERDRGREAAAAVAGGSRGGSSRPGARASSAARRVSMSVGFMAAPRG